MTKNICYCFDKNYYPLVLKSAKSFKKYNPDIHFYCICNDNVDRNLMPEATFLNYDTNMLNCFGKELCGYTHVSVACFVRLLIPKILYFLDRVLYVDGDTICKGDISRLYDMDFEGKYLIGCKGINYSIKQAQELGIEHYINSGVLLFNIPIMNKVNYFAKIKNRWKGSIGLPKIYSADETVLNYSFHNEIKLAPVKYNYCYNKYYGNRTIPSSVVVIWHVTGSDKSAMNIL